MVDTKVVTEVGEPSPRDPAHRTRLAGCALVLFGLAGVAITQPVLDLLGRNPTFFVAGHYTTSQIVGFALAVCLVPALAALAVVVLARAISPRLGNGVYVVAVALFATAFGFALLRNLGVGALVPSLVGAVALGVVVVGLERRSHLGRQFLRYLAIGNVGFLLLFVFASPTSDLLFGSASAAAAGGEVSVPPLDGPVVVVILDEFPLTTILRPDGSINDARYPELAQLARESTWFRNAAAESKSTHRSAPTILSGKQADEDSLPSYVDHPQNYFTLLGGAYPIERYELVTDLCPPDVCDPPPASPLSQAFQDAAVVYGHQVLPDPFREDLPAIDQSWGNFGESIGGADADALSSPMGRFHDLPRAEKTPFGQVPVLRGMVERIGAGPSVNFVHVALPHNPWVLMPWGTALTSGRSIHSGGAPSKDEPAAREFAFRQYYQLHALQVGTVDRLVGELVDNLEAAGAWEDSLLVLMSDHGMGLSEEGWSRNLNETSQDELLRIPLFIKAPGQTTGETRDDPASTLDVLPSIVDLLGIETDWRFDGHSLFDGSQPTTPRALETDFDSALEVVERYAAQFPRGDDWTGLLAVGDGADLVDRPVSAYEVGEPSELSWALDDQEALQDLPTPDGRAPNLLYGTVTGTDETPPELAVAVNGTFAGTVGGYVSEDGGWRFSGVVGDYFVDGANEVVAYEIERSAGGVILHPVGR